MTHSYDKKSAEKSADKSGWKMCKFDSSVPRNPFNIGQFGRGIDLPPKKEFIKFYKAFGHKRVHSYGDWYYTCNSRRLNKVKGRENKNTVKGKTWLDSNPHKFNAIDMCEAKKEALREVE